MRNAKRPLNVTVPELDGESHCNGKRTVICNLTRPIGSHIARKSLRKTLSKGDRVAFITI